MERYISIDGGEFTIGLAEAVYCAAAECAARSGLREEYVRNSVPAHRVLLGPVRISRELVSFTGFAEFERETGYVTEAERDGWGWTWEGGWARKSGLSWKGPFGSGADEIYRENPEIMPVLQVSWNDAAAWCAWRSSRTGEIVRLPSEAEWEVFAGAMGVQSISGPVPAGDLPVPGNAAEYIGAILDDVKSKGGMYGTGLVWEWCRDWFNAYPGGPANREFGEVYKVLRGGSILSAPLQKTAQYRYRRCPTARSPYYGFRTAIG